MKEEQVIKIIDEIFEKHGHIYDGLAWYDDRKTNPNARLPKSLENYFRKASIK